MSYSKGALVTVPGTVIQGRITFRREPQTLVVPALQTVSWVDPDGQQREATFNDAELDAANRAVPPVARIVAVKSSGKKSARK